MSEGRVLAASQDGAHVIRFFGDVRLTMCTTIDDYFQAMFDDPGFASVLVDLCDAEGIDSTTLGMLAKLALEVESRLGMDKAVQSRDDVLAALLPYVEQQLQRGAHLNHITRHILGLYQGVPGAKKFRRHLSENAYKKSAGVEVLIAAQQAMQLAAQQAKTYHEDKAVHG